MATTIKPFPHYQINVKDNSIYTVEYTTILPVHRPLWLIPAERGPVNDPIWCPDYQTAVDVFGKATFTSTSKYFSPGARVLKDTLTYNGAFICRLTDGTAQNSFVILEAWVRKVDDTDTYYEIVYRTRTEWRAGEEHDYTQIKKTPSINGASENGEKWTVYPIMVFSALYPGKYGDSLGFALYSRRNFANSIGNVEYYKSRFYTIAPVYRDETTSNIVPVYDIYNNAEETFAVNPSAINRSTGLNMSLSDVVNRSYNDTTHQLPYEIYVYDEYIEEISKLAAELPDEQHEGIFRVNPPEGSRIAGSAIDVNKWTAFVVDIISGRNTSGELYNSLKILGTDDAEPTATIDSDTTVKSTVVDLLEDYYIFLAAGDDGGVYSNAGQTGGETVAQVLNNLSLDSSFSYLTFLNLMIQFLNGTTNPMIVDPFRYPFTHIYDIGYSTNVKKAMIDFLDFRDDVMVELATRVLWPDEDDPPTLVTNTQPGISQANDESQAATLREYALEHRESLLKGTECCRCAIYAHTGFLVDNTYTAPLPIGTYWSAMKHAQLGNLAYMNPREPRGWPDSYNEYFKVNFIDWINYDPEAQSRAWNGGINYIQWADMSRVFYPALRTVYREETSVLCDQWFVDAVVYTKHVVRTAWGRYTGRNDRVAVLQRAIKEYLEGQLGTLYSGKYAFEVSVYQTAEEQKIGYIQHVLIRITSPATMRALDVDIEVNREGYNPEEE